jgi:Planctomycete cytochrome C
MKPFLLALLTLSLFWSVTVVAQEFKKEVLPVLETHCFKCHGAEEQKSGLRLDSRAALLSGGDFGAA